MQRGNCTHVCVYDTFHGVHSRIYRRSGCWGTKERIGLETTGRRLIVGDTGGERWHGNGAWDSEAGDTRYRVLDSNGVYRRVRLNCWGATVGVSYACVNTLLLKTLCRSSGFVCPFPIRRVFPPGGSGGWVFARGVVLHREHRGRFYFDYLFAK